jgi:hypothetical protein
MAYIKLLSEEHPIYVEKDKEKLIDEVRSVFDGIKHVGFLDPFITLEETIVSESWDGSLHYSNYDIIINVNHIVKIY